MCSFDELLFSISCTGRQWPRGKREQPLLHSHTAHSSTPTFTCSLHCNQNFMRLWGGESKFLDVLFDSKCWIRESFSTDDSRILTSKRPFNILAAAACGEMLNGLLDPLLSIKALEIIKIYTGSSSKPTYVRTAFSFLCPWWFLVLGLLLIKSGRLETKNYRGRRYIVIHCKQ